MNIPMTRLQLEALKKIAKGEFLDGEDTTTMRVARNLENKGLVTFEGSHDYNAKYQLTKQGEKALEEIVLYLEKGQSKKKTTTEIIEEYFKRKVRA